MSDERWEMAESVQELAAHESKAQAREQLAAEEDRRQHGPLAHGFRLEVTRLLTHLGCHSIQPVHHSAQRGDEQQYRQPLRPAAAGAVRC